MAGAFRQNVPLPASGAGRRSRIVRRYSSYLPLWSAVPLVASVLLEMAFRFQETRRTLRNRAWSGGGAGCRRISSTIEDVAQALRLAAQPRRVEGGGVPADYLGRPEPRPQAFLRSVIPSWWDLMGVSASRSSRIGPTVPDAAADHSAAPFFTVARSGETYFGPISFPASSFEPRMAIAVPIGPFRGEVVGRARGRSQRPTRLGHRAGYPDRAAGYAYVVAAPALIAHPDLHLVLQRLDLSGLPQVVAALRHPDSAGGTGVFRQPCRALRVRRLPAHPERRMDGSGRASLTEAYAPLLASSPAPAASCWWCARWRSGPRRGLGPTGRAWPIEELRRGAGPARSRRPRRPSDVGHGRRIPGAGRRLQSHGGAGWKDARRAGLEQKVAERTQALWRSRRTRCAGSAKPSARGQRLARPP